MSESKRGGAQLARAVEKAYRAGQDDYHLEAPDAWNISAIHLQKGKQMLH